MHYCIGPVQNRYPVGLFVRLQAPLLIDPVNQGTGNLHSPVAVLTATLPPPKKVTLVNNAEAEVEK